MRWKTKDLTEWHKHFAWRPIKIHGENVWLETIMRRGHRVGNRKYEWQYTNSLLDIIANKEDANKETRSMQLAKAVMGGQNTQGPLGPISLAGAIMTKKQEDAAIYQKMLARQNLNAMNPEE